MSVLHRLHHWNFPFSVTFLSLSLFSRCFLSLTIYIAFFYRENFAEFQGIWYFWVGFHSHFLKDRVPDLGISQFRRLSNSGQIQRNFNSISLFITLSIRFTQLCKDCDTGYGCGYGYTYWRLLLSTRGQNWRWIVWVVVDWNIWTYVTANYASFEIGNFWASSLWGIFIAIYVM